MPTLLKPKKTKSGKSKMKGTALDSAQRELLERQSQIEAQIKALQESIAGVPTRRPAAPTRHGGTPAPRGRYVLPAHVTGGRTVTVVPAEPRRRITHKPAPMLRAERIAARRQSMALIVCLAGAVIYALSHLLP